MKKVLLSATALAGLLMMSAPAQADGLNMNVGGFFRGYGMVTDNDETGGAGPDENLREFDFRRHTELHFTGETTTDNGLTVGAHVEMAVGDNSALEDGSGAVDQRSPNSIDEVYAYFSGSWGRVNFGSEDGAAYLLQVAAPSGDSNVDGLRIYIQGLNSDVWEDGDSSTPLGATSAFSDRLDYDNAPFEAEDKITYMTPKFNGFQAGASYAPEQGQNIIGNNTAGMGFDDNPGEFEDIWEFGARWDGEFEGFGISVGGGYVHASTEVDAALASAVGSDDLESWNGGVNVTFGAFSVGGAYLESNNGIAGTAGLGSDTTTWVVGASWDNGPYHVGATWMDRTDEADVTALGAGDDLNVERFAIGGGFTFAPGMSVRGAVTMGTAEVDTIGEDTDFMQATVGTDIGF